MDSQIVAVYCLCADMLSAWHHRNDPQCHLTDVEVKTIVLVAALFLGGKYTVACACLREHHYMPRMLCVSRFSRRVHRIKDLFLTLFAVLGDHYTALNSEAVYIIDSFPMASCDTIRIKRSRRYHGAAYRGYVASKRPYVYGLRLHLVITTAGQPVECFLVPGAHNDTGALQWYQLDLPPSSSIIGDKAFNVYGIEDALATVDLALCP